MCISINSLLYITAESLKSSPFEAPAEFSRLPKFSTAQLPRPMFWLPSMRYSYCWDASHMPSLNVTCRMYTSLFCVRPVVKRVSCFSGRWTREEKCWVTTTVPGQLVYRGLVNNKRVAWTRYPMPCPGSLVVWTSEWSTPALPMLILWRLTRCWSLHGLALYFPKKRV